jgi:hypothetical protein
MERPSGPAPMNRLLSRMNQEEGFSIPVLSDSRGQMDAFAAARGAASPPRSADRTGRRRKDNRYDLI